MALVEAIRWHTRPSAAPQVTLPIALVHVSALLAQAQGRGISAADWSHWLDPQSMALIGHDLAVLSGFDAETDAFVQRVAVSFGVNAAV